MAPTTGSPNDVLSLKIITLFGTWVLTIVAALIPLKLDTQKPHIKSALNYFAFFTGGIFLGAGLLHMLPDSAELYESVQGLLPGVVPSSMNINTYILDTPGGFPAVNAMACAGFILIFIIEKVCVRPS
jgi:zinc transporter ZupT